METIYRVTLSKEDGENFLRVLQDAEEEGFITKAFSVEKIEGKNFCGCCHSACDVITLSEHATWDMPEQLYDATECCHSEDIWSRDELVESLLELNRIASNSRTIQQNEDLRWGIVALLEE